MLRGEVGHAPAPAVDVAPRTNLRVALTSFVGRDADVARVSDLVGEHRLVTLTEPGGSGKTRLAVEASHGLLDRMPDGVWLVELAPLGDGSDLPSAVLAAMNLREQALAGRERPDDPIARLVGPLRSKRVLLVLDNCEHVIGAAAALAERLLGECPALRILATSREPLCITGEAGWPVDRSPCRPRARTSSTSTWLLVDRARAARPGFTVGDDNSAVVARVCRALDGMPLAIELAAARLRTMTATRLADGLSDRFLLLTGGSRTARPQHQTLRAVVDWSWELLSGKEGILLRRLAVFAGSAALEAAERVCADDNVTAGEVLDLLTALADKSLLVLSRDGDAPRYRMLETIRAYGLERLDEAGERDQICRRHASASPSWPRPRSRTCAAPSSWSGWGGSERITKPQRRPTRRDHGW